MSTLSEALARWDEEPQATVTDDDVLTIVAAARRWEEVIDKVRRLAQSFNPPADMSINEKQAWKEGVYYALDFILDVEPQETPLQAASRIVTEQQDQEVE